MKIKKIIIYAVLRVLYVFACLRPIRKRRVTFVTLTADELKGDFKLIADYLTKKDSTVELKYILTRFRSNFIGDLQYFFNCMKQIFVINSSSVVVINDNNYVISNFKRKGVRVVQIWHACGAVKKFGNDIRRQYPIKNYDYVISGSKAWVDIYARSFGVKQKQVVPLGVARTDILHDEKWRENVAEKLRRKHPILKGKYVIFYVPTFRGNIIDGLGYEDLKLPRILKQLPKDTAIIYRMHPLLQNISLSEEERIINVADEDLNELYCVADCMVTDYSSVVFDYAILGKKMVLYVPDAEKYERDLGLNVPLQDIPAGICKDEEELIQELKRRDYSEQDIKQFRDKYAEYLDGRSTERIGEFIRDLL